MPDEAREHQVIEAFCARMSELERAEWRVAGWPDEESPGKGECDALLVRDRASEWATDHSKLQSFRLHEYDDRLFTEVVVPAEEPVASAFPGEYVCLQVKVGAISPRKGADPAQRATVFIREVVDALRGVPVIEAGPETSAQWYELNLSESGFAVAAVRQRARRPGCFVRRASPPDQSVQFVDQLRNQLAKKQVQLARQRVRGRSTILLLDTDDFALLNEAIAFEAFGQAAAGQDTSAVDWVIVCKEIRDRRGSVFFLWPLRYRSIEFPD